VTTTKQCMSFLTTGLKMGEALGLKWSDIDLDAGTLRVNRQLQRVRGGGGLRFSEPKNASRRTVGLPQRAVSALTSHRKRQLEEKLGASPLYQDGGLVFASGHGTPLDAQKNIVNRYYKPLLKRAGLPPSGSTTFGIPASPYSLSVASPSATCKPLPGTPPPLSRYRGTPTTMSLRRGAPPVRWVTSYPTNLRPLLTLDLLPEN
jgi:hypothetical protein